jgi:hypothetical protein
VSALPPLPRSTKEGSLMMPVATRAHMHHLHHPARQAAGSQTDPSGTDGTRTIELDKFGYYPSRHHDWIINDELWETISSFFSTRNSNNDSLGECPAHQ